MKEKIRQELRVPSELVLLLASPSECKRRFTLLPASDLSARGRRYWPSGWWLLTRRSPFGTGDTYYPGLLAETQRGRVVAFYVSFPAGGD